MRKPVFFKISSFIMACSLLASTSSITVYASQDITEPVEANNRETLPTINADVIVTANMDTDEQANYDYAVSADNGGQIDITQNVTYNDQRPDMVGGGTAVIAHNELGNDRPSQIHISGNVTTTGALTNGIRSFDDAVVNVGGNISAVNRGIESNNESAVNVNGNIGSSEARVKKGIEANGHSNVAVGGNVYATDYGIKTGIDVSTGVSSVIGATVTVNGSVYSNEYGVAAYAGDPNDPTKIGQTSITINGDIDSGDTGVRTEIYSEESELTVNVGGNIDAADIGVTMEGGTVNVQGNITSQDEGVYVFDGTLNVQGKVTGENYGIYLGESEATVNVEGDVTAKNCSGVIINGGTLNVGGNVTAKTTGITVNADGANVKGSIISTEEEGADIFRGALVVDGNVLGKDKGVIIEDPDEEDIVIVGNAIGATSDDGYALYIYPWDTSDTEVNPRIVVYELKAANEDHLIKVGTHGEDYYEEEVSDEYRQQIADMVKDSIEYIIHIKGGKYSISGAGAASGYGEGVEYKTMTKQQEISITVDSNHYLKGNQAVSVVQDPDNPGRYLVTLNSYFGGIDLRILKKAIEDATGGDVEIEDQGSSEAEETVPQMPIKVTNGYNAEVANADGAVQPARTLTLNMAQISPADMKAAILKAISETPSGGVLRIETDMIACFDREIMEAFDERGDIDIELIFPNEGKKVRVLIPRGVDIEILLDEKGYCGFLRLASILGVVVYDTTAYNSLDVVTVSD